MGLGWYLSSSKEAARRNSPLVQKLDRVESEKGDVLKTLFDELKPASDEDAKLVGDWLIERQDRGDLPYLYLIGLYYGKQDNNRQKMRGIGYIANAALVYRIDAIKCGDPTANQAVPIFEGAIGLKQVRDSLKNRPEVRKEVVANALAYEERRKERARPDWICRHGIKPGSQPGEDAWQTHRQAMRAQFESSF